MTVRHNLLGIFLIIFIAVIVGCASFRSEIRGGFEGEAKRNTGADRVKVLFIFSHVRQIKGLDAIPILENKNEIVPTFDDLFKEALPELSNIDHYSTYTDYASDVNHPERRAQRDSLIAASDYYIELKFKKEKKFSSYFLKTLTSIATASLLPLPYTQSYSLETIVYNNQMKLIATYHRDAKLTRWVQPLLIFAYPFYPFERKREEIYLGFMHDTFLQIESESVFGGRIGPLSQLSTVRGKRI
jgi:hypothetical protein